MINLLRLNKLIIVIILFTLLIFNFAYATTPVDIWKKKDNQDASSNEGVEEKEIKIESPILSDDINKLTKKIEEQEIDEDDQAVIGIFDPKENNFNLDMWLGSDGEDIKKVLKRIDRLKLSKFSENLLFQVLFTNAYPPKNNLKSEEFLKIKIDWLIDKKRNKDLEILLKNNPEVGKNSKAIT